MWMPLVSMWCWATCRDSVGATQLMDRQWTAVSHAASVHIMITQAAVQSKSAYRKSRQQGVV